ncbi:1-deoxy-D-xylulose-5-phosphate synthase [sulfur-oxidizing endosymbiont of Gigantopelta aegis]|uniref:1-deoxy-D-xylulose-5-phosphate synthase n=1 Tax=sulfur-oxidizing endosymbiont of Gigantopelta aegis TaxID=2794934 RepID=UPI0018DC8E2A|nr:1-deoxy-D-xylulose-5-phosphate synthase [sulfur-oxidizing endosymbiont of Gigantopelta aegis]
MTDLLRYPLLATIKSPDDLKGLDNEQLLLLSQELRTFLLHTLNEVGGHLSSNLGAIELTVALHHVFNAPADKIVWDVGHQAYPHKILTGRAQTLRSIRLKGGLSGFPKRSESPYDAFGVGHSSTSISAALGMAIAAKQNGRHSKSIAVIGDGAMTAGMAFEALNHAGDLDADLLVILNDNDMSISPNVGGLSNYFAKVLSGKFYSTVKSNSKKVLSSMPSVWELACRAEEHMKGMVVPGTLFEELGFNYIGPIDGHDLPALLTTLKNVKELPGPQFLHVVTQKGKGFEAAEKEPTKYHAAPPGFYNQVLNQTQQDSEDSSKDSTQETAALATAPIGLTYTQVFSEWIVDAAHKNEQLVGITPAMREGSGLVAFSEQFEDRYYDVGIAEQHSVTFAAGMACEGLKPVVAIYSSFLQRAYDQLIHDVAIQNLPVLFAIDRSGIVGADGATHSGNFDLSFMRCIPNMTIMAPADENECYHMLDFGFALNSPVAVRYPRGKGPGIAINKQQDLAIEVGKGKLALDNQGLNKESKANQALQRVTILCFGSLLNEALLAAKALAANYHISVFNMRFIKPLDKQLVQKQAQNCELLITLEDNSIIGGAGSAVNECLAMQTKSSVMNLGLPDEFPEHATQQQVHHDYGLDCEVIINTIKQQLSQQIPQ